MKPFVKSNLEPLLRGRRVLLGVSGSIAAFKACDTVRWLRDCGAEVRVVLTESAERFVTPVTLEALSGNRVLSSLWGDGEQGTHHIDAARWAEVMVIAPATANILAKFAHGIADDLLSTEYLAFTGPVLIAPAMNPAMYAHAAVRENVRVLRERGVQMLGPAEGDTACGEIGEGRMIEPDEIVESIAGVFRGAPTARRVLVTLGPTQSSIDPVRYVTNHSSGLMGAALAWQAWRAGDDVVAVCGSSEVDLPRAATRVDVQTAQEMKAAVEKYWPESQIYCGAAAVLDWEVASPASVKLKKDEGALEVEWRRSPDILKWVGEHKKPGQFVLGFAAETGDVAAYASRKLAAKNCDAIFANDISRADIGFSSLDNAGWWIDARGSTDEIPKTSKVDLAIEIMRRINGPRA